MGTIAGAEQMLFMVGNCSPCTLSKKQEVDTAGGSPCMALLRPRSPPSTRREKSPKKGSTLFPSSRSGTTANVSRSRRLDYAKVYHSSRHVHRAAQSGQPVVDFGDPCPSS